ncbi:MAG TPA: ferrous iron transport protein A [Desulfosalsimonadaceae bacterium]|nr:ferrous iron transport protein A [Desulfosalsimonadaceae bacterium]
MKFANRTTAKGVSGYKKAEHPQSLAGVAPGRQVSVVDVDAGRELRHRLESMGIFPNAEARVLNNSNHGPMLLSLGMNRIMLGRGMAQKVIVEPCRGDKEVSRRLFNCSRETKEGLKGSGNSG